MPLDDLFHGLPDQGLDTPISPDTRSLTTYETGAPYNPRVGPDILNAPDMSIMGSAIRNAVVRGTIKRDFAPSHLRASVERSRLQRGGMAGLRDQYAGSLGTQADRGRSQNRRLASAAVAGGPRATSFAQAMQDATRRAKARQGIVDRGEPAIQNQSLRDRVAFAKAGVARRGTLQNLLQRTANIREGVNVGVTDANAASSAAQAAMYGGLAGGFGGLIKSFMDKDKTPDGGGGTKWGLS